MKIWVHLCNTNRFKVQHPMHDLFLKVVNEILLQKFCFVEVTIKRMKRSVTDWETFSNDMSDKELYPEYMKNS